MSVLSNVIKNGLFLGQCFNQLDDDAAVVAVLCRQMDRNRRLQSTGPGYIRRICNRIPETMTTIAKSTIVPMMSTFTPSE